MLMVEHTDATNQKKLTNFGSLICKIAWMKVGEVYFRLTSGFVLAKDSSSVTGKPNSQLVSGKSCLWTVLYELKL